ncbi:intraflagellar transport protein 25 homolog [Actinia tenebrosa]|uniref:Intraflagellar transport protein 25 homolog n=1 Tax=Actinia tenebrosa TaxID=6105 RepID=A0A6P8H2A0_ACTTE|nr:intraflagellar transport protein 25 homolog [Actinia tenebrosa]
MLDIALESAGAKIAQASSYDERYPPENIIDGTLDTLWPTSGMFPQEFVISFPSLMSIGMVKVICSNVKNLQIQRSIKSEPIEFEMLAEKELENLEGQMQLEDIKVPITSTTHVRFVIKSGYDHFVSIHRISIDGTAVQ